MGIETRRNNLYYYRKRRVGDRVVSEYLGKGEVVPFIAWAEKKQREEREQERARLAAMRANIVEIDLALDTFDVALDLLMSATLLERGFHLHKRQWRKRRNGSQP